MTAEIESAYDVQQESWNGDTYERSLEECFDDEVSQLRDRISDLEFDLALHKFVIFALLSATIVLAILVRIKS